MHWGVEIRAVDPRGRDLAGELWKGWYMFLIKRCFSAGWKHFYVKTTVVHEKPTIQGHALSS